MITIDEFVKGKKNDPLLCEDGLFVGENIVAIIDGVTSKSSVTFNGKTGGVLAKEVIIEYLSQTPNIAHNSPEKLFTSLSEALNCYCDSPILGIEDYPRASIIVYNEVFHEIWSYGDCQCRVNGTTYRCVKEVDTMNADMRAFYIQIALMHGKSPEEIACNDVGREAIKLNLLKQFELENKSVPFGYPILNGTSFNEKMIQRIPVKAGDMLILATDGYPKLMDDLAESEEALQELLKTDPLCISENRGTKGITPGNISFDDRAYWRGIAE